MRHKARLLLHRRIPGHDAPAYRKSQRDAQRAGRDKAVEVEQMAMIGEIIL